MKKYGNLERINGLNSEDYYSTSSLSGLDFDTYGSSEEIL